MSGSRWVTCFTLMALCLAPFTGLERAQAVRGANDDRPWTMKTAIPGSENTDTPVQAIPCALEKMPTTIVSLASDGTPGDDNSYDPSISADGRFVAFFSLARNLAVGVANSPWNIFLHDRLSGETRLVSIGLDGKPGGGEYPSIPADGRFVAFQSHGSNLVVGDTNDDNDVFVRDLQSGETERVSVASDGTQGNAKSVEPSISADGRLIVFWSWADNLVSGDTNAKSDIFIHDRQSRETKLVSIASDGTPSNGDSYAPAISADGRFVAFESSASNLVRGDTNGVRDVFVHDLQSGETVRVSVASDGAQGDQDSYDPAISADGRMVVFASDASNLVSGDTNEKGDIFVHDLQSGETQRVSIASDGTQGNESSFYPAISGDGHFISFMSWSNNLVSGDTNDKDDIFIHDLQSGETERVSVASDGSQANGISSEPSLSMDGRFVAFLSDSGNLVSKDINGAFNIFVRDRGSQGPTVQTDFSATPPAGLAPLSVTFANQSAGDFSSSLWDFGDGITSTLTSPTHTYAAPGAYTVTLTSSGPGGTDSLACAGYVVAYAHLGSQERASLASDGSQGNYVSQAPVISMDGRYVAFVSDADNLVSGDTNGHRDVFFHDRQSGETRRISLASDGTQGNYDSYGASISADGQLVAFGSYASSLVPGDGNWDDDIFVHDLHSGKTEIVSVASDGTHGNSGSYGAALSADGRYVAFESASDNLVAGDNNGEKDIFVHDLLNGKTERVSLTSDGEQANVGSVTPAISADGRWVAFLTDASNLVEGDANGVGDIFVHDRQSGETRRVSVASDGTEGNGRSYEPHISADGRYVVFTSDASNLVSGDTNRVSDVFVHDLQNGETRRVSLSSGGRQGNSRSYDPSISADGRFVAFSSAATNLVYGDANLSHDVFVHDLQTGETRRASLTADGLQGDNHSIEASISADGRFVVFASVASNLVYSDTNGVADVFVQDWGIQGQPVQAGFEATPLEGFAPLTVTFTNRTTGDGTFNLWTFGDGGSSIQPSPVYTYTAGGVYTVTLMVSGPGGTDTLMRPDYITVKPRRFFLPLVRR